MGACTPKRSSRQSSSSSSPCRRVPSSRRPNFSVFSPFHSVPYFLLRLSRGVARVTLRYSAGGGADTAPGQQCFLTCDSAVSPMRTESYTGNGYALLLTHANLDDLATFEYSTK